MKINLLKILICIICLIGITGCNTKKEEQVEKEKFMIGHTLDDGRVISFTFDVPYKDNGLSLAFSNNEITIDDFINELEYVATLRDGGSKIYKYNKNKKIFGNENFYTIVCNNLEINDIYVAKQKENVIDKCSIKIDDLEGISMSIKEGTLTNTSATIVITDLSKRENIYGDAYRIDKKVNGNWEKLDIIFEGNYGWNSIGYTIGKDKKLEFSLNWETLYGKLAKGEYRIVKDTSEAGEGTTHYLTVEFVID